MELLVGRMLLMGHMPFKATESGEAEAASVARQVRRREMEGARCERECAYFVLARYRATRHRSPP